MSDEPTKRLGQGTAADRAARAGLRTGRIIVAVDDSEQSTWAVDTAGALAAAVGAEVLVLHVIDTTRGFTPEFEFAGDLPLARLRPVAAELVRRAQERLPAGVPARRMVLDGDPLTAITAAAGHWRAHLIVLGTHARGRLAHFLLGSTAAAVIRRARCPVLTVGHPPAAAHGSSQGGAAAAPPHVGATTSQAGPVAVAR